MKKRAVLLAVIMGIMFPTAAFAESEISPTVKILSYDYSSGEISPEGLGSATLITRHGHILTNHHVIQSYYDEDGIADAFQVCFTETEAPESPACTGTASLIDYNESMDLALLKINSKDILNKSIDFSGYLEYDNNANPGIGDDITTIGYPVVGGVSITYSTGKISGFSLENNINYIKTDAHISSGNSGGTVTDEDGNFIGVPTFTRGGYSGDSLGFVVPVSVAVDWIDDSKSKSPLSDNDDARDALRDLMLSYYNANKDGTYEHDYPEYTITKEDDWRFVNNLEGAFDDTNPYYSTSTDSITILPLSSDSIYETPPLVNVSVLKWNYEVTIEDLLTDDPGYYDSYYSEEYMYDDRYESVLTVYTYYDYWSGTDRLVTQFSIPHGDRVVQITAEGDPTNEESNEDIQNMLESFTLDQSNIKPVETVTEFSYSNPDFSVSNPYTGNWYIDVSEYSDETYPVSLYFNKKGDFSTYISMNVRKRYENEEGYDAGDILSGQLDIYLGYGDTILASGTDVYIDGEQGAYVVGEWGGTDYSSANRYSILMVPMGDYIYTLNLFTNADSFDDAFDDYFGILERVNFSTKILTSANTNTELFSLAPAFSDVAGNPYETEILKLYGQGVVKGFSDGTFKPYKLLNRAEMLKILVEGANDKVKARYDEWYDGYSSIESSPFPDVDLDDWYAPYVIFAYEEGIVSGRSDGTFRPSNNVLLSEALKMTLLTNEIDVPGADSVDPERWYQPYMDKGTELGMIPSSAGDHKTQLTRGEMTFIVSNAMGNYGLEKLEELDVLELDFVEL